MHPNRDSDAALPLRGLCNEITDHSPAELPFFHIPLQSARTPVFLRRLDFAAQPALAITGLSFPLSAPATGDRLVRLPAAWFQRLHPGSVDRVVTLRW